MADLSILFKIYISLIKKNYFKLNKIFFNFLIFRHFILKYVFINFGSPTHFRHNLLNTINT